MWNLLSILSVFSLGLITPGPDFSVVVKNSLSRGRKHGFYTAVGIACGIAIHMSYCIFGLGVMLNASSHLLMMIRLLGGLYLIYLGYRSFISSPSLSMSSTTEIKTHSAFFQGFITNLLNPNAVLFFISIFSAVLATDTLKVALVLGLSIILLAFSWFTLVSYVFSFELMTRKFLQYGKILNRVLAVVLILFGVSILWKLG